MRDAATRVYWHEHDSAYPRVRIPRELRDEIARKHGAPSHYIARLVREHLANRLVPRSEFDKVCDEWRATTRALQKRVAVSERMAVEADQRVEELERVATRYLDQLESVAAELDGWAEFRRLRILEAQEALRLDPRSAPKSGHQGSNTK